MNKVLVAKKKKYPVKDCIVVKPKELCLTPISVKIETNRTSKQPDIDTSRSR